MAKEYYLMAKAGMKANLRMVNNTVKENRLSMMDEFTKENLNSVKRMDLE